MAILNILHFPDPRLRHKAKPVVHVDDALRKLVDDMFETMYAAPGIGLAATQVNVAQRLVVIDVTAEKTQPLCFLPNQQLQTCHRSPYPSVQVSVLLFSIFQSWRKETA